MKMGNFSRENGKFLKFSRKSPKISKIGGKFETGGKMHHGLRGMDAPGEGRRFSTHPLNPHPSVVAPLHQNPGPWLRPCYSNAFSPSSLVTRYFYFVTAHNTGFGLSAAFDDTDHQLLISGLACGLAYGSVRG